MILDYLTDVLLGQMWYSFWMTNRWLLLNFDMLGATAVLVTMFLSISMLSDGAGLAALCITSAMAFTSSGTFHFSSRNSCTTDRCPKCTGHVDFGLVS